MSFAIDNKRCMFFVGGDDSKSNSPAGSSYAGGCTKHWWKSELQKTITISGSLLVSDNGVDMSSPETGPVGDYTWDGSTWAHGQRVYKSVNQHPDGEGGLAYYYFYWDGDQWRLLRTIDDFSGVNPRWSWDNILEFTTLSDIWTTGTISTGTATAYFPELKPGDTGYVSAAQTAMGKLMGSDGEPLMTSVNATITDNGSGIVRIGNSEPWAFFYNKGIESGMLMYCSDISYLLSGAGIYEIIDIDPSGFWVDIDQSHSTDSTLTSTIGVGGAWDDIESLTLSNVHAFTLTQEIHVNKDIAFGASDSWQMNLWGHGDINDGSFLLLRGFHRVPGDLHRSDGSYYQSISDAKSGTIDSDCWVNIDLTLASSSYPIDPASSENVIFSGFRFYGSSQYAFHASSAGSFKNVILSHNIFNGEVKFESGVNSITFIDNYIFGAAIIFQGSNDEIVRMFSNIIQSTTTFAVNLPGSNASAFGNLIISGGGKSAFLVQKENFVFAVNNTLIGGTDNGCLSFGGVNGYPSEVVSLNNILLPAVQTTPGYHQSSSALFNYGSLYADNDTVYVDGVGIVDKIAVNELRDKLAFVDVGVIQVDPLLDSNYEPLEDEVRVGGIADVQGDARSIGAIQTMNTSVLNTAVQAALTAQGYTTGRAPKLDNLDQTISTVDTSACKLAADGLDSVVVAEPTGDPSGWSFAKCLRWLIMRFMNKHTSDNYTGIVVHDDDGTALTSQAVTEVSGVKSVGKVQ